jgi:hypothetical protein
MVVISDRHFLVDLVLEQRASYRCSMSLWAAAASPPTHDTETNGQEQRIRRNIFCSAESFGCSRTSVGEQMEYGVKERCIEAPRAGDATIVGNYRLLGES